MSNRLIICLLAFAATLMAPSTAAAANSAVYTDPTNDAVFPHVDIRGMTLLYTDTDVVGIRVDTGLLVGGGRMSIYVDTDQNAATGHLGADVAFFYEQFTVGQAMLTGVWNGSTWVIVSPQTMQYTAEPYNVSLVITRAELGAASGIRVFAQGGAANIYGGGASHSDWAPNSGSYPLDFRLNTQVGGAVGGGGGTATAPVVSQPRLALTFAEARSRILMGMRSKAGRRAKISIARCTRQSAVQRRCAVVAKRGARVWRGTATVREVRRSGRIVRTFRFAPAR